MIKCFVLLLLVNSCLVEGNVTTTCGQKEVSTAYLNAAIDMITKVKQDFPSCDNCKKDPTVKTLDCSDVYLMGHRQSGPYKISPMNRLTVNKFINVYCDMETDGGGWTVIQRRGDFHSPKDFFYQDWKSYKEGFGSIEKDFWLGNDNIFALSNQKVYSARFDMQAVDNTTRYALYNTFWIDDESNKYTLHIAEYSGTAGDAMKVYHHNKAFSTKDQDNDARTDQDCAKLYKGGWWYGSCHHANLNGLYHKGKHESYADGVNWETWKGYNESLLMTEIKIRPNDFRQSLLDSSVTPM